MGDIFYDDRRYKYDPLLSAGLFDKLSSGLGLGAEWAGGREFGTSSYLGQSSEIGSAEWDRNSFIYRTLHSYDRPDAPDLDPMERRGLVGADPKALSEDDNINRAHLLLPTANPYAPPDFRDVDALASQIYDYTAEEANARYGIKGALSFDSPIDRDTARILHDRTLVRMRREDVLARAEKGIVPGFLRFGTALAASIADPVDLASAFVPIVGEATYARMIGRFGKVGARFVKGAIEGAAGQALVEPIALAAHSQERDDYGMYQSLVSIAFGAMAGSALHVGGGLVADAWRKMHPEVKSAVLRETLAAHIEDRPAEPLAIATVAARESARRQALMGGAARIGGAGTMDSPFRILNAAEGPRIDANAGAAAPGAGAGGVGFELAVPVFGADGNPIIGRAVQGNSASPRRREAAQAKERARLEREAASGQSRRFAAEGDPNYTLERKVSVSWVGETIENSREAAARARKRFSKAEQERMGIAEVAQPDGQIGYRLFRAEAAPDLPAGAKLGAPLDRAPLDRAGMEFLEKNLARMAGDLDRQAAEAAAPPAPQIRAPEAAPASPEAVRAFVARLAAQRRAWQPGGPKAGAMLDRVESDVAAATKTDLAAETSRYEAEARELSEVLGDRLDDEANAELAAAAELSQSAAAATRAYASYAACMR